MTEFLTEDRCGSSGELYGDKYNRISNMSTSVQAVSTV